MPGVSGAVGKGASRGKTGTNPPRSREPKAAPQSTAKHRAADTYGKHARKDTPGPTGAEVRDQLRNAGPGQSSQGSRSRSMSGGQSARSRPGVTASLPDVVSGPKTGALITEFLLAVLFIVIGIFTSSKSYAERMSAALWQLTSIFLVFFVLALLAKGEKSGKVALAFGALVDLGIIFAASQKTLTTAGPSTSGGSATAGQPTSEIGAFTTELTGQGAGLSDTVTAALAADFPTDEALTETPQLTQPGSDTTASTGTSTAKPKATPTVPTKTTSKPTTTVLA